MKNREFVGTRTVGYSFCCAAVWSVLSLTGDPVNERSSSLLAEVCLDVESIDETEYVVRPYGFNDALKGNLADEISVFDNLHRLVVAFRKEN